MRQFLHKCVAVLIGRKQDRAVCLRLGQRKDFDDGGSDDAERAFGTKDQTPHIGADRFARSGGRAFQFAVSGRDGDIHDYVLDIAVFVLFHAARVCRYPAAERRKFNAVRLMAHRDAVFGKLRHDVAADGSGLNTRHHVFLVDPENAVHPPHIDRDDDTLFVVAATQCVRNVRSPAKRQQNRIVRFRGRY